MRACEARRMVRQVGSTMGDPGHKASQHLIEGEAYRRIMAGEAPETLAAFAEQILAWLHESHPDAAPATAHDVENLIRNTWHRRHELIRGG